MTIYGAVVALCRDDAPRNVPIRMRDNERIAVEVENCYPTAVASHAHHFWEGALRFRYMCEYRGG
jgi:hypothetical protein